MDKWLIGFLFVFLGPYIYKVVFWSARQTPRFPGKVYEQEIGPDKLSQSIYLGNSVDEKHGPTR